MDVEKNKIPLKKTGTIPVGPLGDGFHSKESKNVKDNKQAKDSRKKDPIGVGGGYYWLDD